MWPQQNARSITNYRGCVISVVRGQWRSQWLACLKAANGACPAAWLNSGGGPGMDSREASFQTALALEALHTHGSVPRGHGWPAGLNEQKASSCSPSLHSKLYYSPSSPSSLAMLSSCPNILNCLLYAPMAFPPLLYSSTSCFLFLHLGNFS